jgi:plasmid stabilization system protein ParE
MILVLSDAAKFDLIGIREHIESENPKTARRVIREISDKLYQLADIGITGVSREWVRSGLRAFPFKNYCLYFYIIDNTMYVSRVLHGSQDVTAQGFPL